MTMMKQTLVIAACVLGTSAAFAQGVKIKKALDSGKEALASYSDSIKTNCGHDIKATIDDKAFGKDEETANTASWGKDTMSSISSLCEDKDYKDAIAKGIKQVVFKYDAGLKTESKDHYGNKFELKGGTFTHSFNKGSANTGSEAREWLQKNL
jgi:hypothetical protein